MSNKKIEIKPELHEEIKKLCEENKEALLVSLATTDGFSVKCFASKELLDEADKLAAMSSTIYALSSSTAKQLLQGEFDITIIETNTGNMLFVRTEYLDISCVLAIATGPKMALAEARYKTKKLSQAISSISR